MNALEKYKLQALALVFLLVLIFAYGNHFNNGFYFDDVHTIVNNGAIRDISNIPDFFTDMETFGTMKNNRSYRPVITMLNAIDYWVGGGLNAFYFHLSIFLSYLILGLALYFLYLKIFKISHPNQQNKFIALFTAGFYMIHTANAETINYIIMRSDSFSTLCVVLGLLAYIRPTTRKYGLHIALLIIGIASKEAALMLVPIAFLYSILFEQELSLMQMFQTKHLKKVWKSIRSVLPLAISGILFFIYTRYEFRENVSLLKGIAIDPIQYFYSQWIVIVHYLANFIFPIELSADPDFVLEDSFMNHRILFSGIILLSLFLFSIWITKFKKWRPVGFGLLWFFFALAPTSSFIPFGQVANDHRTFFAYIGLVIAVAWPLFILITERWSSIRQSPILKNTLAIGLILIYSAHVYGIRERNKVWSSPESLWKDVTMKSPKNGRGLMNYGLTQMSQGKYKVAEDYFNRALEITPYYSYLHINIGVLKNATNKAEEAERYFQNAIRFNPVDAEGYRFYARFLIEKGRLQEAMELIEKGLSHSPRHIALNQMKENLSMQTLSAEEKLNLQLELVKKEASVKNLLNLSLQYFNIGRYQDCIEACNKVLNIDENNVLALNNICMSNIRLGKKDAAIEACEKALEIKDDYTLARNNLKLAKSLK